MWSVAKRPEQEVQPLKRNCTILRLFMLSHIKKPQTAVVTLQINTGTSSLYNI